LASPSAVLRFLERFLVEAEAGSGVAMAAGGRAGSSRVLEQDLEPPLSAY
jgi:hypothetical protein